MNVTRESSNRCVTPPPSGAFTQLWPSRPRRALPSRQIAAMRLIALVVAAVACAPASRTEAGVHATPAHPATAQGHRAVLVSFDAMNEQRVMESVPRDVAPALHELFTTAVCADGARAAFPTLTAPGHAALWTGAFGNVTGIAANTQPRLPLDQFTLLQSVSGYFVDGMRAEPLWLTAARAGRSVVALHVTQAPRSPSYVPTLSRDSAASIARRTSAESLLAQPGVAVVNGYNTLFAPHTALTEQVAHPRPAMWKGASTLAGDRPPIEIAWKIADDSLFGLFFGRGRYTHVVINRSRDVSGGVIASADSVEREWPRDRPLARHFSEPLAIPVGGRTAFVYFRLFDVAPDVSHFLLYQSEVRVPESNTSSVGREYDAAVRGWLGGAASGASVRAFGRAIRDGGDGTAELRFLETAELETRQFMRSSVWGWDVRHPDLFVDYFPLADQLDHAFYGDIARDNPHFDSTRAARIQDIRLRGWSLVDRVVAAEVARARAGHTRTRERRSRHAAVLARCPHERHSRRSGPAQRGFSRAHRSRTHARGVAERILGHRQRRDARRRHRAARRPRCGHRARRFGAPRGTRRIGQPGGGSHMARSA